MNILYTIFMKFVNIKIKKRIKTTAYTPYEIKTVKFFPSKINKTPDFYKFLYKSEKKVYNTDIRR